MPTIHLFPGGIDDALGSIELDHAVHFFEKEGINAAEVRDTHLTGARVQINGDHWHKGPHPCAALTQEFTGVPKVGFTMKSIVKVDVDHTFPMKLDHEGYLMATEGVQYAAVGDFRFVRVGAGDHVYEVWAEHTPSYTHQPAEDVAAALATVKVEDWESVHSGTVSKPCDITFEVDLLTEGYVGVWSGQGYKTEEAVQTGSLQITELGSCAIVETVIVCNYRSISSPAQRHIKLHGELSFMYQTREEKVLMCFGV